MFKAKYISTNTNYNVYGVRYVSEKFDHYTLFLIFNNGYWSWEKASLFKPVEND
jgi:hypothetical protein